MMLGFRELNTPWTPFSVTWTAFRMNDSVSSGPGVPEGVDAGFPGRPLVDDHVIRHLSGDPDSGIGQAVADVGQPVRQQHEEDQQQ